MTQDDVDRFLQTLAFYKYVPVRSEISQAGIILMGRLTPNTDQVQQQWQVMWEYVDSQLLERNRQFQSITYKRYFYSKTKLQRVFMWGVELRPANGLLPISEVTDLMLNSPKVSRPVTEVALVGGRSSRGSSGEMGKVAVGPAAIQQSLRRAF